MSQLPDWRGERLRWFRDFLSTSGLGLSEDFKWGTAVYTYNGKLVCAMSAFKDQVKFNFFQGALLDDKSGVFNSGLDSKQHRSINISETDIIDQPAMLDLMKQALGLIK